MNATFLCVLRISALFGAFDGEPAIGLGAFDVAPTDLMPTYELWGGASGEVVSGGYRNGRILPARRFARDRHVISSPDAARSDDFPTWMPAQYRCRN